MARVRRFYESLFGFEVMQSDGRFCAFRVGGDVLLVFTEGASDTPTKIGAGTIPPHATHGAGHFTFAIAVDALDAWRTRLHDHEIEIESEVHWERGGASLYFRDPDDNLVELATPGVWSNY
jgi:catechol 2,3-dioxygenase-like lactoylglutathione lyase family enzyme